MDADEPTVEQALAFLEDGVVPGIPSPSAAERARFARSCLKLVEFKERVWPHLACFVDASNVARRRAVDIVDVNADRASFADLEAVVAALRKLGYVPLIVSDGNLFRLIDEPYAFRDKYMRPPHSVAERKQADSILLAALKRLPEAACVTNDRFRQVVEQRHYGDVIRQATFFRHRWSGDEPVLVTPEGEPAPRALVRLARRFAHTI